MSKYLDKEGLEQYHDLIKDGLYEYIEGTQISATSTWTGVSNSPSLTEGKLIVFHLPYTGGSAVPTLNLTLPNGSTTGAKTVGTRVGTSYPAGSNILLVYSGSMWEVTSGDIYSELETVKTSVSNGKSAIASAITDKGVSTSGSDSFATMASNIGAIETGIEVTNGKIEQYKSANSIVPKNTFVEIHNDIYSEVYRSGSVSSSSSTVLSKYILSDKDFMFMQFTFDSDAKYVCSANHTNRVTVNGSNVLITNSSSVANTFSVDNDGSNHVLSIVFGGSGSLYKSTGSSQSRGLFNLNVTRPDGLNSMAGYMAYGVHHYKDDLYLIFGHWCMPSNSGMTTGINQQMIIHLVSIDWDSLTLTVINNYSSDFSNTIANRYYGFLSNSMHFLSKNLTNNKIAVIFSNQAINLFIDGFAVITIGDDNSITVLKQTITNGSIICFIGNNIINFTSSRFYYYVWNGSSYTKDIDIAIDNTLYSDFSLSATTGYESTMNWLTISDDTLVSVKYLYGGSVYDYSYLTFNVYKCTPYPTLVGNYTLNLSYHIPVEASRVAFRSFEKNKLVIAYGNPRMNSGSHNPIFVDVEFLNGVMNSLTRIDGITIDEITTTVEGDVWLLDSN